MEKHILNGTFNTPVIRMVTTNKKYTKYCSKTYKKKCSSTKSPRHEILEKRDVPFFEKEMHVQKCNANRESVQYFKDLCRLSSEKNPGDNLDNDTSNELKNCEACQSPATKYVNFGATACDSCRAFFRRAIRTSHYRDFVCRRKNNCKITPSTRKGCQKCRLEKCFSIGMKKDLVLSKDQRLKRFRNFSRKHDTTTKTVPRTVPDNTNYKPEMSAERANTTIDLSTKRPLIREQNTLPLQGIVKEEIELEFDDSRRNSSISTISLSEIQSYRGTPDSVIILEYIPNFTLEYIFKVDDNSNISFEYDFYFFDYSLNVLIY